MTVREIWEQNMPVLYVGALCALGCVVVYLLLCVLNRSKLRRRRESAIQKFLADQ